MVQSELWVILQDSEEVCIWEILDNEYRFNPSMNSNILPFQFNVPVDSYYIGNSPIYYDNEKINEIIKNIFIECMDDDDFMYVLDWQHTSFKYNPRVKIHIDYPVFVKDERFSGGGYNVYFPEFYPNGDYYFFIAKDFRWGYFTHPWLEKVWVFGEKLMKLFNEYSSELVFTKI